MSETNNSSVNRPKIQLEVFVPLGNCACMFQHYLDQVFEAILPYKHLLTFEVKNAAGPEANKYEIFQNTVVVNGREKFTGVLALKDYLARILATH